MFSPPGEKPVIRAIPTSESIEDAELVRRAVEGDRWAEEALFRRYVGLVNNIARRFVGRQADADDIVQDTFMTALEELPKLRTPGAVRGWLLQIAVRHAHRRLRKRKLLRFLGLEHEESGEIALTTSVDPGASAEMRAELAHIESVLSTLPAAHRIAWTLRHVEGEALEDVAQACGCSLATAKRRIAVAEEKLQAHVKKGGAR